MADPPSSQGRRGHLDASGSQEVVFCHRCNNEWYRHDHDLTCPRCQSEITEIISTDSDPRAVEETPDSLEDDPPLHNHNPWPRDDVPDPEDGDLEEYITHSPSGRTHYFSQTFTTHGNARGAPGEHSRRALDPNDPANVIRDFQTMIGQFMGPNLRQGQAGRSGPDALFPRPEPEPFRRNPFGGGGMIIGGGSGGPQVIGHRFTFTSSSRRPRDPEAQDNAADEFATYATPVPPRSASGPSFLVISIRARPDQLASILGGLLATMGPLGQLHRDDGEDEQRGRLPPSLQGLFASLFNPANAVAGDAVYSQEALDRIISTLMEQHPQSNAPGPASEDAIASLPKKKLDEKMLGPELKAECSVCMDDVTVGDEVVVLPCTHWFHESCAKAWLSEHNTCPICRTGIGGDQTSPLPRRPSENGPLDTLPDDIQPRRRSIRRSPTNEARLNTIRDRERLSPTPESGPRRYQIIGDANRSRNRTPSPPAMPGGYGSSFRRRDSELSESQRESRRNTSGSDRSHRSSNSANTGESGGSGPLSWFRRLGGSSGRRHD